MPQGPLRGPGSAWIVRNMCKRQTMVGPSAGHHAFVPKIRLWQMRAVENRALPIHCSPGEFAPALEKFVVHRRATLIRGARPFGISERPRYSPLDMFVGNIGCVRWSGELRRSLRLATTINAEAHNAREMCWSRLVSHQSAVEGMGGQLNNEPLTEIQS